MYFIYKEYISLFSTVKKRTAEFKYDRTCLEDYTGTKTTTTDESFEKIHDKVVDDRLLKIYKIATRLYISLKKKYSRYI